jgi:16S rRNA (cytosine1402-N4)-methyltransferase
VRELLAVQPGQTVIDGTFGAGGHARLLCADLGAGGRFIAIDRDPDARVHFDRFTRECRANARLLRGEFSVVLAQLAQNGVEADAILLDLGVSSMQIDRPERGFSYACDAPLDMRMDPSEPRSARELVNEADERELAAWARSASRGRSRERSSAAARRRRSSGRRSSSTRSAARSRRRAASATATRRSASSRPSESRSTTSSARSSARCPKRSRSCDRVAGSR